MNLLGETIMSVADTTNKNRETASERDMDSKRPFTLEAGIGGGVVVVRAGERTSARVIPCFPWSDSMKYISLRDEKDKELAFVSDFDELDIDSRQALLEALAQASFVLEIMKIESIEEEYEIRNWKVVTRQGACSFQTKMTDWPRKLANGEVLIRDVSGNLFYVERPETMDKKSRKLLWALAD